MHNIEIRSRLNMVCLLIQDIYFQAENRYKTNNSSVREAMFTDSLNLGYRFLFGFFFPNVYVCTEWAILTIFL